MAEAEALCAELEAEAAAWFEDEGVPEADRRTTRVALLRYAGQGNELTVPWAETAEALEAAFAAAHRALYGFELSAQIELVTLRVEARAAMEAPKPIDLPVGDAPQPLEEVPVALPSGRTMVPLYDRADLGAGAKIEGPAIVSQLDTTTLIAPGWSGLVHVSGALLLTKEDP